MADLSSILADRGVALEDDATNWRAIARRRPLAESLWQLFPACASDIRAFVSAEGLEDRSLDSNMAELVPALEKSGLLSFQRGSWRAFDAEARSWLSGRWLEELAGALLAERGAEDVRVSQKVSWESRYSPDPLFNEIDVLARQGEQLIMVSCKAVSPWALEHDIGEERLVHAVKEAHFWGAHFGEAQASVGLVTTFDVYDEQSHSFRSPVLLNAADVLNVRILPADLGNVASLKHALGRLLV